MTVGNDRIISGDRKGNFVDWTRKSKDDIVLSDNNQNKSNDSTDAKMSDNNNNKDNKDNNKDKEKDKIQSTTNNSLNDFNGRLIFDTGLHDLTFSVMKGNDFELSDGSKIETYISAGDHLACQWTLEGGLLRQYIGHSNSVISIDTLNDGKQIITGSFDSTAKLWDLKSKQDNNANDNNNNNNGMAEHVASKLTFSGHTHGVEVCALASGEIVTGTFKNIFIWDAKGNKIKTIENAHDRMFYLNKFIVVKVYFGDDA